ncbi:MAG: ribosome-associated translation inhibitor RaiA, partial [Oscillospiraceae bacterium]
MKVKTIGRKVTLKQNFISMVEKRMAKFDRFFEEDAETTVTVTVEKERQTVEVMVKSKGFYYRSERTATDMETAFSEAADIIFKQIVKNKSRLGSRVKKAELDTVTDFGAQDESIFEVVREKRFEVEPMTVEDAILQMNMLNHSFFVFRNAETDEINIVYRRHDEAYGK